MKTYIIVVWFASCGHPRYRIVVLSGDENSDCIKEKRLRRQRFGLIRQVWLNMIAPS